MVLYQNHRAYLGHTYLTPEKQAVQSWRPRAAPTFLKAETIRFSTLFQKPVAKIPGAWYHSPRIYHFLT